MVLQDLLFRAKLAAHEAIDAAQRLFRSPQARVRPPRELELSDLEDRILLSAVPAALLGETFDAAPLDPGVEAIDQIAGDVGVMAVDADAVADDADAVAGLLTETPGGPQVSSAPGDPPATAAEDVRHELVFVDTSVTNYQQLLDDLWAVDDEGRDLEVVLLSNQRYGIDQIGEALAGHSDLDAIHLVSHGSDGAVKLGSTWLNLDSVGAYAGQLVAWRDALASDADLMIYGCDLAATDDGQLLIESLATLTAADVAELPPLESSLHAVVAGGGNVVAGDESAVAGLLTEPLDGPQVSTDAPRDLRSTPPVGSGDSPGTSADPTDTESSDLETEFLAVPLSFEQNAGQTDQSVDFLARGSGYSVFLSEGDAVLALNTEETSHVVRLDLVGASSSPAATGEDLQASYSNYLLGDNPDDWQTDVSQYGSVLYTDVYEGVDLRYYGNQRQLEYDFLVAAGADPNQIRLNFDGTQDLRIDTNGELVLTLNDQGEEIRFKAPYSYQSADDGIRQTVASQYVIHADGSVGFTLGEYDATRALVIDPVLDYITFIGGTGYDTVEGITADDAGNVYITGYGGSSDFPTTVGALDRTFGGGSYDIYVAKLSADGSSLVYSTFIGGTGNDVGHDIEVDASGNAYVAGYTGSSGMATGNAYQGSLSGAGDAILLKLNSSGTALLYSTYFGGSEATWSETAFGLDLDSSGNAYIAGSAYSTDMPLKNAYDNTLGGTRDAFVAKFDLSQSGDSSLLYASYFGGSGDDYAKDIVVDSTGTFTIAGSTSSTDITAVNAYQATSGGGADAFVTRFNSTGSAVTYSTYLGAANSDWAEAIAVDNAGKIYVGGNTEDGFPTTVGAYDRTYGGSPYDDGFVTKIDPTLSGSSSVVYSTYLGGLFSDYVIGLDVDDSGVAYVTGFANPTFPTTVDGYDRVVAGANDGFFATLSADGGSLTYSTFLGGDGQDRGKDVVWNAATGAAYVGGLSGGSTGWSGSPTTLGTMGDRDGFVAKFTFNQVPTATNNSYSVAEGNTLVGNVITDNTGAGVDSDPDGDSLSASVVTGPLHGSLVLNANGSFTYTPYDEPASNFADSDSFTYQLSDGNGGTDTATVTITVTPDATNDAPVNSVPGAQSVDQDNSLVFSTANGNRILLRDDAGGNNIQLTLTATNGTVTLPSLSGLSVTGGSNGSATVTVQGSLTNLNNALNGVFFSPTPSYFGSASLQVTTNDLGQSGSGGPWSDTDTISITVNEVNYAPVITSNGGGSTAGVSVAEDTTAVTTVTATDANPGDTLTYSISGGADSAKFSIHSSSGVLTFLTGPDFDSPGDADANNVYEVTVRVADGNGGADTQAISVAITNVLDGTGAIAVWRENGTTTPEYNVFDGETFGTEGNSANVAEWEVMQGADAPTRDEAIVVGIDSGKAIRGQMWNGTVWTPLSINDLGNAKNARSWSFDVAYEQQSGDALLVWNDSPDLMFSVWNGSSWTTPAVVTAYTGADPVSMQLAASPDSDEMVLVITNGSSEDYALVWNGTSWGNEIVLNTTGSQDKTDVSVTYEQQSGHAMVVYAKDLTDVHYRIWNGSTWSGEGTVTAPSGPAGKARWTTLAADPNSDRIALGVLTEAKDAYFAVWDGSTWNASDKISATTDTNERIFPNIAVAFESETGQALATYGEPVNTVRYRTWTAGSGWSGELTGPDLGAQPTSMTLDSDPQADRIMLSVLDEGRDVNFVLWDGSGWGTPSEQEIDTGQSAEQPFAFIWDAGPFNQPPTVSLANTTTTLPEDTDTSSAIKIADIVITDDGQGTNDLSLSGTDAALFEIVGSELRLKAGTALDFETNPSLNVTVEVDDTSVGSTPDDTAALAINLTNVNEAPSVSLSNLVSSLPEDTDTTGAVRVADITVTDDALGSESLSLTGADASLFQIVGNQLQLKVGAAIDFETNADLDVTVNVNDATIPGTPDDSAAFSMSITDVNEAPTVSLTNLVASLPEDTDTTGNVRVADIVITDDALGSESLSLTGTDSASFVIVGNQLFLKAGSSLNFEAKSSYDVTVRVDDATIPGFPDDTTAFNLSITDVNEAPSVSLTNTVPSLAENTDTTSSVRVADIVITDDALGSESLNLSGTDSASFVIVGSELHVKSGTSLNFEGKSSYDVTVRVDDVTIPGTPDDTVAFNLTITDVNEAPSVSLNNTVPSLAENTDTTSSVRVADIVINDDALGSESLSLSGADSASFVIVGSELHVKAGTTLNFEAKSSYAVIVQVNDATIPGDPDHATPFNLTITNVNEAPSVSLTNLVPSLAENTDTTGTVRVADIVITDDALGSESLSLAGTDAASFVIVGSELHVKSGTTLNFEAKASYDVTVRVDDATIPGNPDDTAAFNLSITDVNEAPSVALSNLVPSLAEDTNTTGSVRVADIVVTDDALGSESLSLAGADAADFVIVGNELHLAAGTSLNFEAKASYDVTVQVDDVTIPGTPDDSAAFNLSITDVNEAPTVSLSNLVPSLAEDTNTTGTVRVADIVITDDALGSETLTLAGADAVDFVIVGNELHLAAGTTLDFETKASYDVTVRVDDATIPGSPDDTAAFNLSITDVNEAPSVSLTNLVPSLAEDTNTTGTVRVADIVVTDDALGAESLSLSGADAADFVIVGNELHLAAGTSLNFEAKSSYDVTVEVDDATIPGDPDDAAAFNLSITDVNEAPSVSLSNLVPSLAEDTNTTGSVRVADIVVADDALGSESLTLAGTDAADFVIVGNELHLAAGTSLNFEGQASYDVTVEVDDATIPGNPDDSAAFNLTITNVNEAPSLSLSNLVPSLAEDTDTTGTIRVADIVVTDDALGSESLSLAGADAGDFVIVGNELHLAAGTTLNFEAKASYDVTVQVDDATIPGTPDDSAAFNLSITDVNEAPTVSLSNLVPSLAEDTDTTGTVRVADIVVTDDALGSESLTLAGTDAADFVIVGSELHLAAGTSLDFETKTSYDVTVQVDDTAIPGSPDDSAAYSLSITDVNEAPSVALTNLVPSLAEDTDTTAAIRVADVVVTDDALGTESFSLSGTDSALFQIVGSQLRLKAGVSLDFEANPDLDVTVNVNDPAIPGDPEDSVAFNLSITDVNKAPAISLSNQISSLSESTDTTSSIRVADIVITDDALGSESLSLTGTDAADFVIVGSELHLAAGTSLDFESKTTYDVTVRVDDTAIPGSPDDTAAFNLSISDVNEAPSVSLTNLVPSLAEDTDTTGTVRVADIVITDDALGSESLSLAGADASDFVIVGSELHLAAGTGLDFETKASYDVTVEVNDAAIPGSPEDSVAFNLSITDANEAPSVSLTNLVGSLAENTDTTGTVRVADIVVTDDALGMESLSLSGSDAADFVIVGGELHLAAGTSLNFEAKAGYDVTVEVNDTAIPGSPDDSVAYNLSITDVNEAPSVSLTNLVPSLAEDTNTTGTVRVADIVITDDALGSESLSLAGTDAADFVIVGSELHLAAGTSLNFEAKASYDVTVRVDDAAIPGSPDDSVAYNLSITDVNEAPSVSLTNTVPSLAEDTDTTGTVRVADIVITDDDLGSESLSLSGTDAGNFVIVGSELHLAAGTSLNFEAKVSYDVTVEVDDTAIPGSPDDTAAFNLSISDVNEAPSVSLSNLVPSLAKDTDTTGTVRVADIVITDDALGSESLSLAGADAADFVIVGSELHLAAGTSLDFETKTSYDVTVQVNDAAIPGDPDDSAALNLTITDANEAPSVSLTNLVPTLAEDTNTTGTVRVADIVVTDDALGSESLSLSGADAADFVIVGSELHLAAGTSLDFEAKATYDVTVRVDDAAVPGSPDDSTALSLTITDVNEGPTVSLTNLVPSLAEDTDTTGTVRVADIVVTDDALGSESLSLTGADAADFVIVGNELHLAAGTSLDFEAKASYDVSVEVNDTAIPGNPDDTAALNLSITDGNEAPSVSLTNLVPSLAEDTDTTGTVRVADIVVTDDALGSESLSLDGTDAADFVIVGSELHLAAGTSLDFETKTSYDVTVEVDDAAVSGTPDDSAAFNLTITDVNEAPSVSLTNLVPALAEDTDTTGTVRVADIVVADDALGTESLSLTGADAADFVIVGSELHLAAGTSLDFEAKTSYDVTVQVDDAAIPGNPEDAAAFNLTITDVNEAPTVSLTNVMSSIAENTDTTSRIQVADIVVADDALGTNDLALSGADSTLFEIDGNVLYLKAGTTLDHLINPALDVTVEVDDTGVGASPDDMAALSIAVTDVNTPPTISLTNLVPSLPEDTDTTGTVRVADIVVTDDALGSESLSLSGADAANFVIVGNELHLAAGTTLDFETKSSYGVTVDVNDAAIPGDPEDSAAFNLSITGVNDAPVLDLDADDSAGRGGADFASTFVEDGGSVAVADGDATIADADNATLQSLTVTITNLLDGTAESLSADTSGTSISASYNAVTGVLTLSGADTLTHYQQVLRSVAYANTSQNPDTTDRVLSVVANDGLSDSNLGTTVVDVVAENDAPVNTVPGGQVTAEGTPLVFSSAGGNAISISDVDVGSDPVIVTLTVTNGTATLGTRAGLTFGTGDGVADATMTFVGTIAEVNNALKGLRFDPAPDYFGPAIIQITVDDQGQFGIGAAKTDLDTIPINVTPVNDAPVAKDAAWGIDEHSSAGTSVGTVSATDADPADSLTYRLAGGSGSGVFGIDPVSGEITVVDPAALVYEITPTFDLAVEAEDSAGATATATVTVSLININRPPTANSDNYAIDQGRPLMVIAPGVLANDTDPDGGTLTVVLVTSAAHGALTLGPDGTLSFTPDAGFHGHDTFTYRLTDSWEQSGPATVTIEVRPLSLSLPPADDTRDEGPPAQEADSDDESSDEEDLLPPTSQMLRSSNDESVTKRKPSTDTGPLVPPVGTLPAAVEDSNDPVWLPDDRPESLDRRATADATPPTDQDKASQPPPPTGDGERGGPAPQALLWSQLDAFQDDLLADIDAQQDFQRLMVGASAVGVTGLVVGYVTWSIYGGTLLATMVSTLPAWVAFDPLPVLESFAALSPGRREEDDISFESLVTGS